MHDLVHDLAQSVVGSHEVKVMNVSEMDNGVSENRRLQLILEDGMSKEASDVLNDNAKKLRTIFCRDVSSQLGPLRNKRLRVMYSLGSDGLEIPSTSFKFKHLRYLQLMSSKIESTHAASVSQLYNLQTLDLSGGQNVLKILKEVGPLKSLRHLILHKSDVKLLPDSIMRLVNLQTLNIGDCFQFESLPVNIGSLQHLVFLDVSSTNIKELPDSITSLCNLRRLEICGCKELKVLPSNFGLLTRLRSLDLYDTAIRELPDSVTSGCCSLEDMSLGSTCKFPKGVKNLVKLRCLRKGPVRRSDDDAVMPRGIDMLTRLEILIPYVVMKKEEEVSTGINISSGIEELAGLNFLEVLEIRNLDYVRGNVDSILKYKQNMVRLGLTWKHEGGGKEAANNSFMVLEGLQPHPNLTELAICSFPGLEFPKWIGSSSCLANLMYLDLNGPSRCEKLPTLGMLPCLEVLSLLNMSVKCFGNEVYNQESSSSPTTLFPSLIHLALIGMGKIEEWVAPPRHYNSFPLLKQVTIHNCPELTSVPDFRLWSSLSKLTIVRSDKLKESIPNDHLINLRVKWEPTHTLANIEYN